MGEEISYKAYLLQIKESVKQTYTCSRLWSSETLIHLNLPCPSHHLHHLRLLLTLLVWVCMDIWGSVWQAKGSFLSLLSTWMGAVSEMEVLMISVLEANHSQSPLLEECRFYDSDFHKSEVTSSHTQCQATKA